MKRTHVLVCTGTGCTSCGSFQTRDALLAELKKRNLADEIEVVEERKKKLALKMTAGASGRQDLKSPMAGNVRTVLVQPGDAVTAGQVLLILEAMKMQNEIKSPIDGVVGSVTAREGITVSLGDPLCVVDPLPQ